MQAPPEGLAAGKQRQSRDKHGGGDIGPARGAWSRKLQEGKGEADRDQQLQRAGRPREVEQQQAGHQASHAVADDVGELHQADAAAQPVEVALHGLLHHREREAHDERGRQNDDREQQQDQRRVGGVRPHDVVIDECCGQDPGADTEIDEPRAGQCQRRCDALHQEEEAARIGDAVDEPRAHEETGRVAQQEHGQHQREAVAVRLQQNADQPVPDDLQRHDQEAADEHQQRPAPDHAVRRLGGHRLLRGPSRFHVEAARQQQAATRDDEIDQGAEIDGLVEADRADQIPAAEEGADARPQCVEAVEPSDELRGARDLAHDRLGQERQRAAHQEGRP